MSNYTVNALVIHRTNLGESDRILTLFTKEEGKLAVVAKGSRKPTSKFCGASELFTLSRQLLATGKTLDILNQCEILNTFPSLRFDLDRLARATYFCELLDRLTLERDPFNAEELFDLTNAALSLLQNSEADPDMVTHAYELHLLSAQGYAPVLDHCVRCSSPLGRGQAGFSPALGGMLCYQDRYRAEDAVSLSAEAVEILQTLVEGETEAWLTLKPTPKVASEMARAMRWYIRTRIDRPLKSADFLDQLRASQ